MSEPTKPEQAKEKLRTNAGPAIVESSLEANAAVAVVAVDETTQSAPSTNSVEADLQSVEASFARGADRQKCRIQPCPVPVNWQLPWTIARIWPRWSVIPTPKKNIGTQHV